MHLFCIVEMLRLSSSLSSFSEYVQMNSRQVSDLLFLSFWIIIFRVMGGMFIPEIKETMLSRLLDVDPNCESSSGIFIPMNVRS